MSLWFFALSQFSVLAYALVGGVFLAFSDFIMRALARAETPGGIDVMQNINREVFRYVFMTLFLGMAVVSLIMIAYAAFALRGPSAILIIGSAIIYLAGVFGVTIIFNVPLNNRLDSMDHSSTEAAGFWSSRYLPGWTFWNSVRTAGCVLAASLHLLGLIQVAQT